MNAFTHKPDVSKFVREVKTDDLRRRAASQRVMAPGARHMQSLGADCSKAQINLKPKDAA